MGAEQRTAAITQLRAAIAEAQWLGRRLELMFANVNNGREAHLASDLLAGHDEAAAIAQRLSDLGFALMVNATTGPTGEAA